MAANAQDWAALIFPFLANPKKAVSQRIGEILVALSHDRLHSTPEYMAILQMTLSRGKPIVDKAKRPLFMQSRVIRAR